MAIFNLKEGPPVEHSTPISHVISIVAVASANAIVAHDCSSDDSQLIDKLIKEATTKDWDGDIINAVERLDCLNKDRIRFPMSIPVLYAVMANFVSRMERKWSPEIHQFVTLMALKNMYRNNYQSLRTILQPFCIDAPKSHDLSFQKYISTSSHLGFEITFGLFEKFISSVVSSTCHPTIVFGTDFGFQFDTFPEQTSMESLEFIPWKVNRYHFESIKRWFKFTKMMLRNNPVFCRNAIRNEGVQVTKNVGPSSWLRFKHKFDDQTLSEIPLMDFFRGAYNHNSNTSENNVCFHNMLALMKVLTVDHPNEKYISQLLLPFVESGLRIDSDPHTMSRLIANAINDEYGDYDDIVMFKKLDTYIKTVMAFIFENPAVNTKPPAFDSVPAVELMGGQIRVSFGGGDYINHPKEPMVTTKMEGNFCVSDNDKREKTPAVAPVSIKESVNKPDGSVMPLRMSAEDAKNGILVHNHMLAFMKNAKWTLKHYKKIVINKLMLGITKVSDTKININCLTAKGKKFYVNLNTFFNLCHQTLDDEKFEEFYLLASNVNEPLTQEDNELAVMMVALMSLLYKNDLPVLSTILKGYAISGNPWGLIAKDPELEFFQIFMTTVLNQAIAKHCYEEKPAPAPKSPVTWEQIDHIINEPSNPPKEKKVCGNCGGDHDTPVDLFENVFEEMAFIRQKSIRNTFIGIVENVLMFGTPFPFEHPFVVAMSTHRKDYSHPLLERKDIELVVSQTGCSEADAALTLLKHKCDVVNAIMELTPSSTPAVKPAGFNKIPTSAVPLSNSMPPLVVKEETLVSSTHTPGGPDDVAPTTATPTGDTPTAGGNDTKAHFSPLNVPIPRFDGRPELYLGGDRNMAKNPLFAAMNNAKNSYLGEWQSTVKTLLGGFTKKLINKYQENPNQSLPPKGLLFGMTHDDTTIPISTRIEIDLDNSTSQAIPQFAALFDNIQKTFDNLYRANLNSSKMAKVLDGCRMKSVSITDVPSNNDGGVTVAISQKGLSHIEITVELCFDIKTVGLRENKSDPIEFMRQWHKDAINNEEDDDGNLFKIFKPVNPDDLLYYFSESLDLNGVEVEPEVVD